MLINAAPIRYSILDLAWITQGGSAAQALLQTRELAMLGERLGFYRYWLAEHHNLSSVACCATSVVLGYVAAHTATIRIGSGGVMLPNHAPLVIAEQFGTLDCLYPGRIDLGLGRAPGTDATTVRALRRDPYSAAETFPQDVQELQAYFAAAASQHAVTAVPAVGRTVPIWILGSSTYGAQLAAALGLPFAFASHFAPQALHEALHLYRQHFRPSAQCLQPYVMVSAQAYAADTEAEALACFSSQQQSVVYKQRGQRIALPPPDAQFVAQLSAVEHAGLAAATRHAYAGTGVQVAASLQQFAAETQADEVMIASAFYHQPARLHSYELIAQALAMA